MVASTSKAASFHYSTEVHGTIRAANELEIKFHQQVTRSWNAAATAS
jgi:hypothetical protein